MSKVKEMSLSQVKADVNTRYDNKKIRTMSDVKNLTARNNLNQIKPVGNKVLVSIKSWPAQSTEGILLPDSYTVIRGEMYITEVLDVGEDVDLVSKGDIAIMSMFSGYHITTISGHAKIIPDSDILAFKKEKDMKNTLSFNPKTFSPGTNYILVEMLEKKRGETEAGILTDMGDDSAYSNNDAITKTAKIIKVGPINEYGKTFKNVKVGSTIIFDSFVGIEMNPIEVVKSKKYKIMYSSDILGYIDND